MTGGSADLTLQAFFNDASGQLTMVGFNTASSETAFSGTLTSLPPLAGLDLYYTTASNNLFYAATIPVTNGQFAVTVPPDSVFTLTGFDPAAAPLSLFISSPTNTARFAAPATIPIQARMTIATGTVALVQFFNGSDKIGETTNQPYSVVWSNVPAGVFTLSAQASNSTGNFATSPPIQVSVVGPFSRISLLPTNAQVLPRGTQQFAALATDSFGTAVDIQPAFTWAVNGGGSIGSNGLLTATGGVGGPFTVQASVSNVIGLAAFLLTTNLARDGTGYTWYSLNSPLDDLPFTPAPEVNDGDLTVDIPLLSGGGVEQARNQYEAAGVIWGGVRTISRVIWHNGGISPLGDGVFSAEFGLQFSLDGTTWSDAGPTWALSSAYPYDSAAAANRSFAFSGDPISVRGVRCVGLVHTSDTSGSWAGSVRELESLAAPTLPVPLPSLHIDPGTNGIALGWNGWAHDYFLESSTNLGLPSSWVSITNLPEAHGENWRITLPPQAGPQFFRLRKP